MAGDWIKLRTSILTNPRVSTIAKMIGADPRAVAVLTTSSSGDGESALQERNALLSRYALRYCVVTALHCVWSACNEHSTNGVITGADLQDVDEWAGIPGFGEAMKSVQWIEEKSGRLIFPNFDEYNTCGKDRHQEQNAERQRRYRERRKKSNENRNVTNNVTRNDREEKRREEKNSNTHTHRASVSEIKTHPAVATEWGEQWERWIDSWEGRNGRPLDLIRAESQLAELGQRPASKAKADLEFSISKYSKSILDSDNDFSASRARPSGKTKPAPVRF